MVHKLVCVLAPLAELISSEYQTVCRDEADEFVEIGALNGIFVLGRSMGFIGEPHSQKKVENVQLADLNVSIYICYIRTLLGPEETETGFVSPPLGRHLLCAP